MNIKDIHNKFLLCQSICIDNRRVTKDCMFVAIKGEKFDANQFAQAALSAGAKFAIIDNKDFFIDNSTILVANALQTLQQLATYHRNYLNIPIIALTGSNGKTTTKELIDVVLKQKYLTTATIGNLNNHIGVPLTLLSFNKNTEIGIVEMGANHQKEIAFLCDLALPDYGYITNFGKAHLEGFGGIQGVIKGKSEMYDHLRENHKIVFVNANDPLQIEKAADIETVFFGENNDRSFVHLSNGSAEPFVEVLLNETLITSHLIGKYNASNINIAIAIGKYFGINDLLIKTAIESYIPDNNRSQMLLKNGHEIILDAYNANPSSMKAALENFVNLQKNNKIVFLGDMFELGKDSIDEHLALVKQLEIEKNITCHFIGKDFYGCKNAVSHFCFYETFEDLQASLKNNKLITATILIKGSRGMALERILDFL